MTIEYDEKGKRDGYIARADDASAQRVDINRLRTQSRVQNDRTKEFLDFPAGTHIKKLAMPYCGGGEAIEAYLPYLNEESEIIFIDKGSEKVEASINFAKAVGFKGKITGRVSLALDAFKELKAEGIEVDCVDAKLGTIWDEHWDETLEAIHDIMPKGGKVIVQDMDPASMWIDPQSEHMNRLLEALLTFRGKFKYENNISAKLGKTAEKFGFKVVKKDSYQTITQNGDENHEDVYRFFRDGKVPMTKFGGISESDFDTHLNGYHEELQTSEMAYPVMHQWELEV